ncbi:MAG: hypothetical protein ACOC2L_02695 [Candidatus Sumerlaeota bacterium]
MRKALLSLTILTCILFSSACQIYEPGERAYISDYRYETVQDIYDTTGSLELTRESLREDPTWSQAEINEAIYRLKKQYQIETVDRTE